MNIYEEIVKLQRAGHRGAVATIVNSRGSIPSFQSAKMLIRDDGSIAGTIGGGCVEAEVWQAARDVISQEKPRSLSFDLNQDPKYDTGLVCGGTLEIFIEPVLPMPLLYIFGAGHVALELFKTARNAGFDCIVADDRDAYANAERFPDALQVIARDFNEALADLAPSESSYIVICTRGHRDDMRILRWAVQTPARYIGMVGSKRKAITVFRELTREGLDPALFDRVHSPVGLDIGAITPEEIAVSIAAELIAMRRHAERALPHMSWFHSSRHTASAAGEGTDTQLEPSSTPAEAVQTRKG
jgi:xanthine dehydrogenase accessory factor